MCVCVCRNCITVLLLIEFLWDCFSTCTSVSICVSVQLGVPARLCTCTTSVNDYIVLFHKDLLCTYCVLSFVLSTKDTTLNRESLCFGSLFHSSKGERRQISTKKKIKLGQGRSLGGNGEAI